MMNEPTGAARDADDEALLARCIQRWPEIGAAAIDEACEGDPLVSARLHARLASLEKLGLLPDRGATSAPASRSARRTSRRSSRGCPTRSPQSL